MTYAGARPSSTQWVEHPTLGRRRRAGRTVAGAARRATAAEARSPEPPTDRQRALQGPRVAVGRPAPDVGRRKPACPCPTSGQELEGGVERCSGGRWAGVQPYSSCSRSNHAAPIRKGPPPDSTRGGDVFATWASCGRSAVDEGTELNRRSGRRRKPSGACSPHRSHSRPRTDLHAWSMTEIARTRPPRGRARRRARRQPAAPRATRIGRLQTKRSARGTPHDAGTHRCRRVASGTRRPHRRTRGRHRTQHRLLVHAGREGTETGWSHSGRHRSARPRLRAGLALGVRPRDVPGRLPRRPRS